MQLTTILNRVEYFKSFVYGKAKWVKNAAQPTIEVRIEARKNGRPICSVCERPAPSYDRLPQRRFEYVPLWGIAIYFIYAMRRVECPTCGVRVEKVPWCDGKNQRNRSRSIETKYFVTLQPNGKENIFATDEHGFYNY